MNLTRHSKVIVQGITEKISTQIALMMRSCGTNVVAGISPGEGGEEWHGIPVSVSYTHLTLPTTSTV